MREIEARADEPKIQICESLAELEQITGLRNIHGFFDAEKNLIVATSDSLAHEVAHFKDYRSGRMLFLSQISDPLQRVEAKLRNEIVAILFAYTKSGTGGASLSYEHQFMRWLEFIRASETALPHGDTSLSNLKFSQIQDLAETLCQHHHAWFARLEILFGSYLKDEHLTLTYGQSPIRR